MSLRLDRFVAFICLALVAWTTLGEAAAHASLVSAEPADGAVIEVAPSTLTLRFNEDATPLVARLIRPDGRQEILRDLRGEGLVLTIGLPSGLGQGTHIVSWRVASQDGHPIAGAVLFSVGAATALAAPAIHENPEVRIGLWLVRLVLAIGMAVGVGGVVFMTLAGHRPVRADRIVGGSLLASLVTLPAFIGLQGLDALGLPVTGIIDPETWRSGLFTTAYGRTAVLMAASFLVAVAARQGGSRLLAVTGLLLAGAAVAASGHASSATPQILTRPAVWLHVLAVCLWIGALAPLALLLRASNAAIPTLLWFSKAIAPVVAVLVVTGVGLAVIQLGSFGALLSSDYGLVLLAKLGLVGLMLVLAAVNRFRLTGPTAAGDTPAKRQLIRSIWTEFGLALLILGVVGLWRFTPPPRALAAMPPATQTVHVEGNGLAADLTLSPPLTGPAKVEVSGLKLRGRAISPVEITVELGKPSFGVGPFLRKAQPAGDDRWEAAGFVLPMDGFWIVRLKVVVSDFESVELTDVFDVKSR